MTDKIFSVGEAANWLATGDESSAHAANQLRRFRSKGYVKDRGKFGTGPTATHTFNAFDLAAAKFCKGLMRFGIKSEKIMRAVSEACYDLPVLGGETIGVEAIFSDPHAVWSLVIAFNGNADGTDHVIAQITLGLEGLEEIGGELIVLTTADWLPELAEMGA
jgi:hypothetical protein